MRGEVLLFLPVAGGLRITDEFQHTTYGQLTTTSLGRPHYPHQRERFRFCLSIDLGGGIVCTEVFDDLAQAQAFAETFLRRQGVLG
ncbi:hypothetical protein [Magnetospirillum sulfuroxidans]|uniref:Uncharacterized protein n=1 Tax=Magnetospirillum sulfuroxidans TaxID=611300 RepID=A0ABS5IC12_9PROT|nr:hypothetical protein [Magnetospirillum sulfuroxidans]MBR9971966.1 hypothetical protein [Magnetospirillum sulfuroxidans]